MRKEDLPAVLKVLPALKNPTVSHLSDESWLAVNTILDEPTVRVLIPRLRVSVEIERQLETLSTAPIARQAIDRNCAIVIVASDEEAVEISNEWR